MKVIFRALATGQQLDQQFNFFTIFCSETCNVSREGTATFKTQ